MKLWFYLSLFLFFSTTTVKAEGLNYYGRVFYNGAPVQTESAEITFQITGNDPNCVLYEEVHGNVLVKNGLLNEIVGAVGANISVTYRPVELINFEGVFKNTSSYTCQNGGTYNPLTNPERNLVVYFRETPLHNPIKLDPKPIKAVPLAVMAQDAEKLAGKDPSSYLQVSAITDQSKLDQLVLRQPELLSLIPASGPSSAVQLPTSNSSGGSAGMIRYNSTNFTVEYYNGSGWTGLTTGTGLLTDGTLSGVLYLQNNGLRVGSNQLIAQSGYIGIGTASPSSALHVVATGTGGVKSAVLASDPGDTGNSGSDWNTLVLSNTNATNFKNLIEFHGGGVKKWEMGNDNNSNGTQNFYLRDSVNSTYRIYISANGKVGINTTSPDSDLELEDNGSNADLYATGYGAGNHGTFMVRAANGIDAAPTDTLSGDLLGIFGAVGMGSGTFASTAKGAMYIYATQNWTSAAQGARLIFRTTANGSTASSERMRIDENGEVGIGTTSPNYELDVQGDINASGSVRAAGVALTSDIRFKRDIHTLDNALAKILRLRGVSYEWRSEEFPNRQFNERSQIGVIAQEVEMEFPELVDTDKDGYKSVNYPALVAPLIESIKELYGVCKFNEDQIEEINSLRQENAEIKARLERIEKRLQSK